MWETITRDWMDTNDRSQAWLARKAGISDEHFSQCLNGHRFPGLRTLKRLERAMDMIPGRLVCADHQPAPEQPANA